MGASRTDGINSKHGKPEKPIPSTWLSEKTYNTIWNTVNELFTNMYADEADLLREAFRFVSWDRSKVEIAYRLWMIRKGCADDQEYRKIFQRYGVDPDDLQEFTRVIRLFSTPSQQRCLEEAGLYPADPDLDYPKEIEALRDHEFSMFNRMKGTMNEEADRRLDWRADRYIRKYILHQGN